MESDSELASINCLPEEIIVKILQYNNDHRDLVNFGLTCKRFYDIVKNNYLLWRTIYKQTLPEMLEIMEKHGTGDWYTEVKEYHELKNFIYSRLMEMTFIYYKKTTTTPFKDVCSYFNVHTLSKSQNYFYTMHILQDLIVKTRKLLNNNTSKPPFTLSELYYARTALRYYFHAFLALKWSIHFEERDRDERPPPISVINFFVQWIYGEDLELDKMVDEKILELAAKVELVLKSQKKRTVPHGTGFPQERVLEAVGYVLYKQRHILSATDTAHEDTLDVVKVLKNKMGHHIVILAIYQALARHFDVHCELNVFPNHLFLEWRSDWSDPHCQGYIVDVSTGALKAKGRCPFSRGGASNSYRYNQGSLIESLYVAFHRTKGYIKDWHTQNSVYLIEFMNAVRNDTPYGDLLARLRSLLDATGFIGAPLNLKIMSPVHRDILTSVFDFGERSEPVPEVITVKEHPSSIKYAVGMICSHVEMGYKCVVKSWSTDELLFSDTNPYMSSENDGGVEPLRRPILPRTGYCVLAFDLSTRYVPPEYLTDVKNPSRLPHLEEYLAPEFSHFDGFRYVPNAAKRQEYPGDDAIASMYASRVGL